MNIIEQIENEYRQKKDYGIQFSIEPEAYKCDIPDNRIVFGDANVYWQNGNTMNDQPIFVDGIEIGFVHEYQSYNIFAPITTSFMVYVDDNDVTDEMRKSPHFDDEEWCYMAFATLQQMIDYLRDTRAICLNTKSICLPKKKKKSCHK